VLDRRPSSVAEAIDASGLGWSVVKKPIAVDQGADLPDVANEILNAQFPMRAEAAAGHWAKLVGC
jgi:hypothetical protein